MVKRSGSLLLWCAMMCSVGSAQAAPDLLIEAELDQPRVHVLSQAVYRVRFLHAVDVATPEIIAPSVTTAETRAIGTPRVGVATRDGRRYRTHEQAYAVFPFASGALQLSATASGKIISSSGTRQAVRIAAPARTLDVLPAHAEKDDGDWLPAASLRLSETWANAFGTAQRRTIRIDAAGIDGNHLPALRLDAPGLAVQAETPRIGNRFDGDINIGWREQSFLLLPTGSNEVVAPPLQLRWWNTATGEFAVAALSARPLRDALPIAARKEGHVSPTFVVLALCMLLLLHYRVRIMAAFKLWCACHQADLRAVRDGMLGWSAHRCPHAAPRTLAALAERIDDAALRATLQELDRALYGPAGNSGDASLRSALRRAAPSLMMKKIRPLPIEGST